MSAVSGCGGVGGFVVGFTVHEGRELTTDGTAIDPVCVVRCEDREYTTEVQFGKESHVKFNESHIWDDLEMNEIAFASAFIEFELQAANSFFRNDTVGSSKVQLSMVRNRPNHSFDKKELQLSNGVKQTAKLQVTVWCYGAGDTPPQPRDQERDTEVAERQFDDLGAAVLNTIDISDNKDAVSYNLFLQVHRAEHLGGGDELLNPYLCLDFQGPPLTTRAAKQTHSLSWDECFRVPVTTPIHSDAIVIQVLSKQDWGADNIIVQGQLSFTSLRTQALKPRWFNFYNFSRAEVPDPEQLGMLHEDPEENSYYGRLLVSARVHKVARAQDLLPADIIRGQLLDEPASTHTAFLCDIIQVSGCPGTEVTVEVGIQRTSKTSKKVKRDTGIGSTDPSTPGTFSFPTDKGRILPFTGLVPTDPIQQTDLIMSVWAKGVQGAKESQRVGFLRIKPDSIKELRYGVKLAPRWYAMKPMAHLPAHVAPGAVLCTIFRAPKEDVDRPPREVRIIPMVLRCYIISGRHLRSPGQEQPNSFVQVECGGMRAKTKTAKASAAPVWQECLKLKVDLMSSSSRNERRVYAEPVKLTVYDRIEQMEEWSVAGAAATMQDRIGAATGDMLAQKRLGGISQGKRVVGRVSIHYDELTSPSSMAAPKKGKGFGKGAKKGGKGGAGQEADNTVVKPRWIKISGGVTGTAHTGDLLLGFQLMKAKYDKSIPELSCHPPTHECTLSVSLYGLRNIPAPTATEVKKDLKRPHLEIRVPSFSGEAASQMVPWLKKPKVSLGSDDINRRWDGSKPGTSSFEFLEVMHMKVQLPKQRVWDPHVHFNVLDEQGGDKKIFVGEGLMSLQDICPWMKGQRTDRSLESMNGWNGDDSSGEESEGISISDDDDDIWQGGAGGAYDTSAPASSSSAPHPHADATKPGFGGRGAGGRLVESAAVQMNGLPTLLSQQTAYWAMQPAPFSCCPTPSIEVPYQESFLNYFTAKEHLLDVRGPIKELIGEDDDDSPAVGQNRPVVPGKLEDHLPPMVELYTNVQLSNGQSDAGYAKLAVHVVRGDDEKWPHKLSDKDKVDKHKKMHFLTEQLRTRYRRELPRFLRARVYVIRGLNVSGARRGAGNPYLWLQYGTNAVELRDHVQKQTTEPRFFKVDEKDIHFPEEMVLEVGLKDFDENGHDLLIGSSTIDLEDRFCDLAWQRAMRFNKVPIEYRPLETGDATFQFRGSLEMWVELIDAASAAEIPANVLMMPPAGEVEIRVVLSTCRDISLRLCIDEETHRPRELVDIVAGCTLGCKTFGGPQPLSQETDVHYSSDGEAEYQWRFVWSRIAVTKGVPLDCQIQLVLNEHFSFAQSQMMCEAQIEMKNYCRKVANTGDMLELDAEIPLNNPKLTHILAGEDGENSYLHGYDDFTSAEEYDGLLETARATGITGLEQPTEDLKKKHAAGFAKINVQVWPQPEASMQENQVGLGREEPNRLPVVKYPTTGRNWKATLPGVATAVDKVQNAVKGKWLRLKCVMILALVIAICIIPFVIKDSNTKCPYALSSCIQKCGCCGACKSAKADPSSLCYYPWQSSNVCEQRIGCNCAESCDRDNPVTACKQLQFAVPSS